MESNKKFRVCLLSAAAVLMMIILVWISGALNTQKIWPDVQLNYQNGKMQYSIEEGDSYGMMTSGPYDDLPAGRYRIKWQIENDGINWIHLFSSNGAAIEPAVFETAAGEWQGEAEFEIKDAVHNFSIGVEFASGTWMKIHNFRLYSPEYSDHAWTFAFAAIALWLLFMAEYMGWMKEDAWRVLAAIVFTAAAACVPCFSPDCIKSHDMQFHAARIMNLADGMSAGQFHVRVGGFSYNGYGAATSVFYPDLLLYPLALMVLGGASITYIIHLSCFAVSLLSGWSMYAAAKRMLGNRSAACCAALLYISSVYRLEGMYRRYMLGEMLAMAVLPIFMLGLWEVIRGDSKRWPILMLGATLIFQSHMCTTLLCAFFAVCVCAIFARQILRDRARLKAIALAIGATILLNLGTLIPFADLYLGGVNSPTQQFGFVSAAYPIQNLILFNGQMGLIMWPAIFACFGAVMIEKDAARRGQVLLLLGMGGVFSLFATNLFPWQAVVDLTKGLIEVIQFPWRFLTLATVMISLCGGYAAAKILPRTEKTAMLLTLALSLVTIWPYILDTATWGIEIPFGNGANPYLVYPEYQYERTDVNNTRSKEPLLSSGVQMTRYEKDGTQVNAQIDAQEDGVITFPMFGFDGYEVKLNGQKAAWKRAENNRLAVDIPAGTQGELEIRYAGKLLWHLADGVSVLTAAALIWYMLKCRKQRKI